MAWHGMVLQDRPGQGRQGLIDDQLEKKRKTEEKKNQKARIRYLPVVEGSRFLPAVQATWKLAALNRRSRCSAVQCTMFHEPLRQVESEWM